MSALQALNSLRREAVFTVDISYTRFALGVRYLEKRIASGSHYAVQRPRP